MPKETIDYSNTVIYKISSNDLDVKDFFIGHTTNFIKRKHQHKFLCNSGKKNKMYDFIRSKGGWSQWSVVELEKISCKDAAEARIREQEYIAKLNALVASNKDHDITCGKSADVCETETPHFACECGRIYKHRQSLHNHRLKCQYAQLQLQPFCTGNKPDVNALIVDIMKQLMSEQQGFMKDMMVEVLKNSSHNTTNNTTHNNSHNKTFNLQFFLNETCKNAMNITEFVDSIKLQLSDLINIGEVGYVEGISNIITNNLKALDITERPIHCTDKKREVVYIKDEDKWEKEDESKNKMRRLIKKIAYKNEKLLPLFKERYPDYKDSESKNSDKYSKIVIEAMGGMGNNDMEKEDKIIRNISKVITIDKDGLL